MNNAEIIISLAKDVLERLEVTKPKRGKWVHISNNLVFEEELDLEFRDYIRDKECQACALGNLFLAYANVVNHMPVRTLVFMHDFETYESAGLYIDFERIQCRLETVFSIEQLVLIEIAFELGQGRFRPTSQKEWAAHRFGLGLKDSKSRLKAIMENIINNGGEFKP